MNSKQVGCAGFLFETTKITPKMKDKGKAPIVEEEEEEDSDAEVEGEEVRVFSVNQVIPSTWTVANPWEELSVFWPKGFYVHDSVQPVWTSGG